MGVEEKQTSEASALTSTGFWKSKNGEVHIFRDKITNRLSYEELIGDGSERIFGFLDETGENAEGCACWEAELMIFEEGEQPWYGPSSGEKPEVIGTVQVRLLRGDSPQMETCIKTAGDEAWQPATVFDPVPEDSSGA